MVRTGTEHLLLSERLFQQFIVYVFTKIESQRLSYHTGQLANKRMCRYQHLVDQMEADETDASSLVQRIILSASYTGSPRYMFEKQQNALAYVNKYGKPTLFISLTSNPFWKEIQDSLIGNQKYYDCPDISTRIFRLKLADLIDRISNKKIFG